MGSSEDEECAAKPVRVVYSSISDTVIYIEDVSENGTTTKRRVLHAQEYTPTEALTGMGRNDRNALYGRENPSEQRAYLDVKPGQSKPPAAIG